MSHDAYTDRLLDLAYGELSGRDARKVEAHVASCDACRAELGRIRETRALMSRLAHEPAPPDGERILLAAAREAAEARRPRRRLPPWLWGATVAVTALVAVGAVSYRLVAMRPGPLERDDPEALLGGPYVVGDRAADRVERQEEAGAPSDPAPSAGIASPPRPKAAPAAPAAGARRKLRADSREAAPRAPAAAPAAESSAPAQPPAERQVARAQPSAEPDPAPAPPPAERHVAFATPERSGPSRAREEARGASRSATAKAAAPGEAPTAVEVRTFPGCEGEATRRVERDAQGRIVRYVREGTMGGRRLVVEHVYGADGALARATVRDLDRPGAAVDVDALGVVLVVRAEDARPDAPPRCGPRDAP